jgi:hypothetical protein
MIRSTLAFRRPKAKRFAWAALTFAGCAAAIGLAAAHAQTAPSGDDKLRVNNILRHMQRLPFAPRFVPAGFSGEPLRLRRSSADAPVQIVEASLAPGGQIAFQLLSRPLAAQFLNELGGAPMMGGGAYTATPAASFDIQALGRKKPFAVKCWTGHAPGRPEKDLCAAAVDPEVIVVATVEANAADGVTASGVADLRVRSVVTEGVSYWAAIDDQMLNDFLGKLVK